MIDWFYEVLQLQEYTTELTEKYPIIGTYKTYNGGWGDIDSNLHLNINYNCPNAMMENLLPYLGLWFSGFPMNT